jgi:tetratricopeptide (TPR) repeat protein
MKLRILLAGLICGLVALAADTGGELYQKAITLEKADGNLKEAIQLYQRVAQEFSSDRALAAKALMQAAHCYELLGPGEQDKAIKIYEQVAREFGDQRQPAESARTKLASLRFEVASVKQAVLKPNEGYAIPRIIGGPGTSDPGRITFLNFSLNWLLRTASG